jgi:hypothetical protein
MDNDELIGRHVFDHLGSSARWPSNFNRIDFRSGAQPEMQTGIALGNIAATAVNFLELNQISGRNLHLSTERIAILPGALRLYSNPIVFVAAVVSQDGRASVQVINNRVNIAVVVYIAKGDSTADARDEERIAAAGCDFGKAPVVVVMEMRCAYDVSALFTLTWG